MTIEQIIQLTQAGFTAEQITALAPVISQHSQPAPEPQPQTQPEPQPQTQPEPQPQTQPDTMSAILAQLNALTTAIQVGNINGSSNAVKTTTSADVAASIINPPQRNK